MSLAASWMKNASCRHMVRADYDPWMAHPHIEADLVAEAKAVCAVCPVRPECAEWALERPKEHGVWGGLTADERRALRGRTRSRA